MVHTTQRTGCHGAAVWMLLSSASSALSLSSTSSSTHTGCTSAMAPGKCHHAMRITSMQSCCYRRSLKQLWKPLNASEGSGLSSLQWSQQKPDRRSWAGPKLITSSSRASWGVLWIRHGGLSNKLARRIMRTWTAASGCDPGIYNMLSCAGSQHSIRGEPETSMLAASGGSAHSRGTPGSSAPGGAGQCGPAPRRCTGRRGGEARHYGPSSGLLLPLLSQMQV